MEVLTGASAEQGQYLVLYLLIGTLVWRYLSSIFYWVTEVIAIERWEGTIEYTLMAPVPRIVHLVGHTSFAVVYSMLFTSVILLVTVLLFDLDMSQANMAGGLVVMLAGSFSFVGIGVMGAVLPLLFPERGAQMTHIIVATLLLISGVYYPVEVLPEFLQTLSKLSPAWYVLQGTRAALLEGAGIQALWQYIWLVIILAVIMVPAGLRIFDMAERYAKRTGKLARNG
jgi:ABC-2 type transport system permease protein